MMDEHDNIGVVNILEFQDGKILRETRYYADPFEAPAWRAQWVEPVGEGEQQRGMS